MTNLISVVIVVSVLSMILAGGASHFSSSKLAQRPLELSISSKMLLMATEWSNFYRKNDRFPGSLAEASGFTGNFMLPSGWALSSLPADFVGWCMEASVDKAEFKALVSLASSHGNQYGISDNCGARNGLDTGVFPDLNALVYPVPVTITYFFSNI
jgi:hypothetical protein